MANSRILTLTQRPSPYTIDRVCGFLSEIPAQIILCAASFKKGILLQDSAQAVINPLHDFLSKSHTPVSLSVNVVEPSIGENFDRNLYFGFVIAGKTIAWLTPEQMFQHKFGGPGVAYNKEAEDRKGRFFWDATPLIVEEARVSSVWHDSTVHAPFQPYLLKS